MSVILQAWVSVSRPGLVDLIVGESDKVSIFQLSPAESVQLADELKLAAGPRLDGRWDTSALGRHRLAQAFCELWNDNLSQVITAGRSLIFGDPCDPPPGWVWLTDCNAQHVALVDSDAVELWIELLNVDPFTSGDPVPDGPPIVPFAQAVEQRHLDESGWKPPAAAVGLHVPASNVRMHRDELQLEAWSRKLSDDQLVHAMREASRRLRDAARSSD